jgi:wobble nucleotide-excising tRNase
VTAPVRGGEALEAVAELQAEVRALREQLSRMEQWVFAVDVSVGELDDVVSRRFRGLES